MEQGKTIEDRLDEDEAARGFSCIGKFLESDIKGAIGDVSAEEGGRFETVGAFEKDGTTPKAGWLKLFN